MKKLVSFLGISVLWASSSLAQTEWVNLSKNLSELDMASLAVDTRDPKTIFAGSERRVYKTADGGDSWRRVFTARGSANRVRFIYVDPLNAGNVYVCTDRGLQRSKDGGKHWSLIFSGVGDKAKSVFCVANSARQLEMIWIGTGDGLFLLNIGNGDIKKVEGFPETPTYSIVLKRQSKEYILVTSQKGIYRNVEGARYWERVFVNQTTPIKKEEISLENLRLEQLDVEELPLVATFSNLIFLEKHGKFYAATPDGILEGTQDGASWNLIKGQNLPKEKINYITKSSTTFYAATDQGIFQWDFKSNSFKEIYKGLDSKEVRALSYSASGDYLLAATKKGVFRWSYPELDLSLLEKGGDKPPHAKDILDRFRNDPSILEIQNVAVQYAEVHPSKIEGWRRAAAMKAFLPTLSVDHDLGKDQNIDVDRGGTADPDKFIAGPDEKSFDWSVGVSWDLGDLIWNDAQTSIDVRSRLMVELRDDILSEVTHLYYERRRLQVEMALAPARELSVQLEKEIRLQELTAGIDALTGGYLSRRLKNTHD